MTSRIGNNLEIDWPRSAGFAALAAWLAIAVGLYSLVALAYEREPHAG